MRDRIPGAPGQYTAVVTSAELQKLQNAEQFIITLMRDDQPLVEGTPYSKAAVLPDEVASRLCPEVDDPTPADAFQAAAQHLLSRENPHGVTAEQIGAAPAIEFTASFPGCYCRTVDGEREWINPPMLLGVEYRTTERWDGKVVWTALINCGYTVNGSTKTTYHGINMTQCLNCVASGANGDAFPVRYTANEDSYGNVYATPTAVYVYTEGFPSPTLVFAKLRYIKD